MIYVMYVTYVYVMNSSRWWKPHRIGKLPPGMVARLRRIDPVSRKQLRENAAEMCLGSNRFFGSRGVSLAWKIPV